MLGTHYSHQNKPHTTPEAYNGLKRTPHGRLLIKPFRARKGLTTHTQQLWRQARRHWNSLHTCPCVCHQQPPPDRHTCSYMTVIAAPQVATHGARAHSRPVNQQPPHANQEAHNNHTRVKATAPSHSTSVPPQEHLSTLRPECKDSNS